MDKSNTETYFFEQLATLRVVWTLNMLASYYLTMIQDDWSRVPAMLAGDGRDWPALSFADHHSH